MAFRLAFEYNNKYTKYRYVRYEYDYFTCFLLAALNYQESRIDEVNW